MITLPDVREYMIHHSFSRTGWQVW